MRVLFWASLWLIACSRESLPPPSAPPPETDITSAESARPPRGSLWRDEVDAVVDGGLGRFLGFVQIEAYAEGNDFVGWRIVDLQPADTWAGVDLRPGDVVTRINGRPLEHEDQAYTVFTSLKHSPRLTVTYLRGDQQRELVWRIVDRPGMRMPPASPSAAQPRPAPSAASGRK